MEPQGLLFDMVQCLGCRRCIKACLDDHGFPGDAEAVDKLSATAYTAMRIEDDYPVREMCRHCVNPSCASVCPVGALHKTDLGPVVYDADRCIGCRYCIMACPFNVPRYEWHEPVPAVRKCDLCHARLAKGEKTACAAACPAGATISGPRKELLAEARRRIAADPDEYHPHIYGEAEAGGTSVLFLAPRAMPSLGFDKLGTDPLPALTWNVLSKVPGIAVCGAATMFAFWWITRRRDQVALVEGALPKEKANGRPQ